MQYRVCSVQFAVGKFQSAVCNVQFKVRSVQCSVCSVQCSVQCAAQCTVGSMYSVQCRRVNTNNQYWEKRWPDNLYSPLHITLESSYSGINVKLVNYRRNKLNQICHVSMLCPFSTSAQLTVQLLLE